MNRIHNGLQRLAGFGFTPNAILDIGAYEGWFAECCRAIWPNAFVFMIEAMPEKEDALRAVAGKIGNSEIAINVLGKQNGATEFFVARGGTPNNPITTGSSLYPEKTGVPLEKRSVNQVTLDTVAPVDRKFDLLKLDVQGAELDVLAGANRCIQNASLILLEVSVLQYNEGSPLIAEVIAYMKALGFVAFDVFDIARTRNGHLIQLDILFIREDSRPKVQFFSTQQ